MATVQTPQFTDSVDLRYFLEPLNAPTTPVNYLDRFPNTLYNKSPDSHFIRFMTVLLGPVGVGWLAASYTLARLKLEARGSSLFDLDAFYGNPFAFGRILTESFDQDISGLLPTAVWNAIRAQDEAYRSRAIQFMNAARLGGTPEGMALAATSGLGQEAEVVENYRYLFDRNSDSPLGLKYYGSTTFLGEFIVIPRPALSRTQQQAIKFGAAEVPIGSYPFTLSFNGFATAALPTTSLVPDVQSALEALPTIGQGNCRVTGGPVPNAFIVTFTGLLSNQDLPALKASFFATSSGHTITIPVVSSAGGVDPNTETVVITDIDRHHMQVAIDRLRPVASFPTFYPGRGTLRALEWTNVSATTAYSQAIRFVTGSASVAWPPTDSTHWIEATKENIAPELYDAGVYHYVNFHNFNSVTAYQDNALSDPAYPTSTAILTQYPSTHIGPFPEMRGVMPFFAQFDTQYLQTFTAGDAVADYPDPLTISAQNPDGIAFLNRVYPADYATLPGVPTIRRSDDHFWASAERTAGAEILEIDLGTAQAVNYISLEVTRKPVRVTIDYDVLDQAPSRIFAPVVPRLLPFDNTVFFEPSHLNPWAQLTFYFDNGLSMIYTRLIRITFTRTSVAAPGNFLYDANRRLQTPWSIDVRNLRIGRNVAPSVL